MRHLGLTCILFVLAAPLIAQPKGYVWANEPSTPSYAPPAQYAFNSAGGAITISRGGVGIYRVVFVGLARGASGGGNVQVNAYGAMGNVCNAESWGTKGADFGANVRCFALSGGAADAKFSMLVTFADLSTLVAPAPVSPSAAAEPKRSVRPDGTVVLKYPDGRMIERFPRCGYRETFPDGTAHEMQCSTGAPVAAPPRPPADDEEPWLSDHAGRLLEMIRTLVGGDQDAVDEYLRYEGANATVYDQITKRRFAIARMIN
jgi:hypothetical protein